MQCQGDDRAEAAAAAVVDAALRVQKALGPGLLESVYEACLAHELAKRGISFRAQVTLPVRYDGVQLDAGFRVDLLVEDRVIVELKAVETLLPIHEAQLITYLKLSGLRLGLLLNFHVRLLREGMRRIAY
ncbi:MAG: GxxExxY protein [Rhodocyclaceae bacterium]|nr:GxxExxY protein [Rhodocyclaceae bacterium]